VVVVVMVDEEESGAGKCGAYVFLW